MTDRSGRPLRFGLQYSDPDPRGRINQDVAGTARRAEAAGYDTLLFPDHLGLTGDREHGAYFVFEGRSDRCDAVVASLAGT